MARPGTGHSAADAGQSSEVPRQYVNFAFYRLDPAWRRLPPHEREVGKKDFKAVVEEFGSTTVVFPGQQLEVDPHGILIVRSSSGAAA